MTTEHKPTEEALRESEERYRSLIEASPDIIVLTDLNANIIMINQQGFKLLGYEQAEEMIGKSGFDFVAPEDLLSATEVMQRTFETGHDRDIELTLLKKDGTRFPAELSASLIRDREGNPKAFTAVLRDITKRKRAEKHLAYQAQLLANVHDALIATDERLILTAWNRAAEEMYGWQANEVLGRHVSEVIRSEFTADQRTEVLRAMAETGHYRLEALHYHRDGHPINIEGTSMALRREDGQITGYVTVNRNITERKQAEAKIRQHTARMEVLAEISQSLTEAGLDVQAVLETIVQYTAEVIGDASRITLLSADEQWFQPVALHHPKPEIKALLDSIYPFTPISASAKWMGHILRTGQPLLIPILTQEQLRQSLQPEYLPLFEQVGLHSVLIVPLRLEGRVIGSLGLTRDQPGHPYTLNDQVFLQDLADRTALTIQNAQLFEQVQSARERLQTLSHQLVELQEAERRHIGRELHDEVGQLLTGLKLVLEMIARRPADQFRTSLAEAQTLVNDLMAQVRTMSFMLRPAMLDDLGLLPALLWQFEKYTAQFRVQVKFEHSGLDQRFQLEVETTAYRLVQEALTNVARHAGVSQVTVRLWLTPERLMLQIEDEGRGFDMEAALTSNASTGLSGMRERVMLLGGRLTMESTAGVGTRLVAELPLQGWDEPERKGNV
jgi:PAS domain S-box-containing protein